MDYGQLGIPGASYAQDNGAGLGYFPPAIPGVSFQDAGVGLPPGQCPPVPPFYFQDHNAGLAASKSAPYIMPGTWLPQDHGKGLSADRFPPAIPLFSPQDAGAGLPPGHLLRDGPPEVIANPFALLGQPPVGQPRYDRQRALVWSTRQRPQARPTPAVIRHAPPRRLSSTRVSKRPERIEESRPELVRDRRRLSALFGLWLIASLISAILAYKIAQTPGPSGSSASGLVYVTATGDPAQSITWWFFGSCLSFLAAVGCFIANLREDCD